MLHSRDYSRTKDDLELGNDSLERETEDIYTSSFATVMRSGSKRLDTWAVITQEIIRVSSKLVYLSIE